MFTIEVVGVVCAVVCIFSLAVLKEFAPNNNRIVRNTFNNIRVNNSRIVFVKTILSYPRKVKI